MSAKKIPISHADWSMLARREANRALRAAQTIGTRGAKGPWRVSVDVIGAPAMRRLNQEYRGKDRPTDVLSFPAAEIFKQRGVLGDLLICLPVLRTQAKEQGHDSRFELRILVIHGVLHLLGFDHEAGGPEARRMAREEGKLLRAVSGSGAKLAGLIDRVAGS